VTGRLKREANDNSKYSVRKNWRKSGKNLIEDGLRHAFEALRVASAEIECSRLVAANDASGFDRCPGQRDSESDGSSEVSTAGNGQNDGDFGDAVEGLRGDDQDGSTTSLFVPSRRLEVYQPDFTALH
jgi:hypothetical protein